MPYQKHYRNPANFHPIRVSGWEVFRLIITPFDCCRTRYQKSLHTLLSKAEYRLHQEMNLGPLLGRLQESHNFIRSLATTLEFPTDLLGEYKTHYSNAIQISMDIDKSLEFEDEARLHPIPVQQSFNITADNVRSIADCAYKTLSTEREFYTKLNEKIILKRALHETGEDRASESPGKENYKQETLRPTPVKKPSKGSPSPK